MKVKLNLDKRTDIMKFVDICSKYQGKILLTDGNDFTVSAKSLLGVLCTFEWSEVWCVSEEDIYTKIKEYVVE